MDTRLRNLLHDLANEMPVDVEGSSPRTLRRARIRRGVTAGATGLAVIALVVASLSAIDLFSRPTTPLTTGPNPQPAGFAGLWPETDAEALAVAQAAADQGHQPMRTTPEGTATLLATNLLGWQLGDVQTEHHVDRGDTAEFVLSNRIFGDPIGVIVVDLQQLGRTGPNGVWSVVGVSMPPLEYPPVIDLDGVMAVRSGVIRVSGTIDDLYEGAPALEAHVFDGPALEPSLGSARYELTDRTFAFDVEVSPTPDGRATLLLTMPDAVGASLGAVMLSVETPVGATPTEPSVNVEGVPPNVAVTAQRVYDAAKAKDFDALAELIDPNTFIYNLGDASDPIPEWRADPSVLDLMVAILEMPSTVRDIGPGYGTFYFWPYLVNSDFSALSSSELEDLTRLGYSDREIRLMIDGGAGYQGPRLAIDEEGRWRNFITVGE